MALNPFIEFAQDPVGALAWLGYFLILLSLAWLSTIGVWRLFISLTVDLAHQSRWEITVPKGGSTSRWKWVPPGGFVLKAAAIPFVLGITAWALSAVGWLVT